MAPARKRQAQTIPEKTSAVEAVAVSENNQEGLDIIKPLNFAAMKVAELREELVARGLSPKGLKKDLVDRLQAAVLLLSNLATEAAANEEEQKVEDSEDSPATPTKRARTDETPIALSLETQQSEILEAIATEVATTSEMELTGSEEPHGSKEDEQLESVKEESKIQTRLPPMPTSIEMNNSPAIHISNLVRPFTIPSLKELVSQFGEIQDFALDSLKANCYVLFTDSKSAYDAKEKLHQLKWPFESGKRLEVEFCSINKVQECKEAAPSNKGMAEVQKAADPVGSLDKLFRKTETEPSLYYLPAQ